MKTQLVSLILAVLVIVVAGCARTDNSTEVGLPNPASVYCEEQGGKLEIREGEDGQYGICVFDDGSECEEWAFYRGECAPGVGTLPTNGEATLVHVDELTLNIMESFPVQVNAVVRGNLADGCVILDGIEATREGNIFTLEINARSEGEICTMALVPFEEIVSLEVEGLPAGVYTVVIEDLSATFTFDVDNG